MSQLVQTVINEDLLLTLARSIHKLPFESRKDTQVIFSYVLRFKPSSSADASDPVALSFVVNHRPEVVTAICRGYDRKESALPCGSVLREILKHEAITAIVLYNEPGAVGDGANAPAGGAGAGAVAGIGTAGMPMPPNLNTPQTGEGVFWRFFDWIEKGTFEVSADAFTTFRVCSFVYPWATAGFSLLVSLHQFTDDRFHASLRNTHTHTHPHNPAPPTPQKKFQTRQPF